MLDCAISHQQPILHLKALPVVSRAVECLFMKLFVFRMRFLNYLRERGRTRLVKVIDPIGLGGPVDLIGYRIPAETARETHGLGLIQVSLTAPQGVFGAPTLGG